MFKLDLSKLFGGGKVVHEARSRNRYPRALVDLLVERYGLKPGLVGADVGASTGRLTALFLEHGYNMVAIEPDESKRKACSRLRERWEQLEICPGTPVATGLGSHSVDFAVSQRALYWPDQAGMRREVRRILRPRGPIALITDSRVYNGAAQSEAYVNLLRKHCPGFREKLQPYDLAGKVAAFFKEGEVYEDAFMGQQSLTLDALIGQTSALPICPAPSEPGYQPLLRALRDHFEQWSVDGAIVVPTVCRVAVGRFLD